MNEDIVKQSNNNNLKRGNPAWKKGKSGNPNGRPRKEACITTVLQSRMGVVPQIDIGGKVNTKTWAELIADSLLVNAYKGNAAAMHELMDRIEGKVAQPVTGADGEPISFTLNLDNASEGTVDNK